MLPIKLHNSLKDFFGFGGLKINHDLTKLGERLDSMFDNDVSKWTTTDDSWILEIDVPGIEKDDMSISLNSGYLTIEGRTNNRSVYKEYYIGEESEEPSATLKNGVLYLGFAKKERQEGVSKKIEVK